MCRFFKKSDLLKFGFWNYLIVNSNNFEDVFLKKETETSSETVSELLLKISEIFKDLSIALSKPN